MSVEKIAVLGSGNGGVALAGHLKFNGYAVHLYDKFEEAIRPILEEGGITVKGESFSGFAHLNQVGTNLEEAVEGCSMIVVVTPAFAHREIAEEIAPFLKEDQVVILHPGRTGGALEFRHILKKHGVKATVAETQTLLYACRRTGGAEVTVYGVKKKVALAALPSAHTEYVVEKLNQALPHFIAAPNVLFTSLHNIGAIFHPAPMVLNTGRIEAKSLPFEYYHEGITPSVATLLEKMDQERVEVAKKLGIDVPNARDWLYESYGIQENTLYEAIQKNKIYSGILAPDSLQVRYISEDVPMSLVPISSLGRLAGIPTPAIDSIIELASILHQVNYRDIGRNLENLGLNETPDSIRSILEEAG